MIGASLGGLLHLIVTNAEVASDSELLVGLISEEVNKPHPGELGGSECWLKIITF